MTKYKMRNGKIYKLVGTCDSAKCNDWCCSHIVVRVPYINTDDEEYFKARGISVKRVGNQLALLIKSPCKHLLKNGKCGIYSTRFTFCRKYAKTKNDPFSHINCGIEWREITGRESQIARSRLLKGDVD